MKVYGNGMKATEFSIKQIGVIYKNVKLGNLSVKKEVIDEFYKLADYYGFDDNHNVERSERLILSILNSVFENDMESAQKKINAYV